MKYYNLIENGEKTNAVIAVDSENEDEACKRLIEAGYDLEECERPIDANITIEEPQINHHHLVLRKFQSCLNDPFQNVRHTIYDGPNCARCANRFRHSDFCDSHFDSNRSCYRFKLEK